MTAEYQLRSLAHVVRREAEAMAHEWGTDPVTLTTCCAIVSLALAQVCRAAGFQAELVLGWFDDAPVQHFWVGADPRPAAVPPQRQRRVRWAEEAWLIDLTATQFFPEGDRPLPVVLLPPAAEPRAVWALWIPTRVGKRAVGAVTRGDVEETEELAERSLRAWVRGDHPILDVVRTFDGFSADRRWAPAEPRGGR